MGISLATAEQDFAAAFDAYGDAIFRHCRFRVFDRERAKELMQDVFMKTWEYVARGHEIDNIQAFLYRTANNVIVDEIRRATKRKEVSFEEMQEAGFDLGNDDDAKAMKGQIDEQYIVSVLEKLDPSYRNVLVMRYIDELKPAEIANILGESANVISVRINRGMSMLRTLLPDG